MLAILSHHKERAVEADTLRIRLPAPPVSDSISRATGISSTDAYELRSAWDYVARDPERLILVDPAVAKYSHGALKKDLEGTTIA